MSIIPDCPECAQGKHGNCDGTSWNPKADDVDTCPCAERGHAGTIGEAVLGDVPQCNGRCGVQGYGEDAHPDFDRDCPIHGDAADDKPEWCIECKAGVEIVEQSIETSGYEEQQRDYHVTRLSCGHEIAVEVKQR
jgi:hypothetical protein